MTCVCLIGVGGSKASVKKSSDGSPDTTFELIMAIVMGLLTGVLLTLNSINVNFVLKRLKFPADQMSFDGQLFQGLVLLPLMIYSHGDFTLGAFVKANMSTICVTLAVLFFNLAMNIGKGATIQAIYNAKVLVQTGLGIVINRHVPEILGGSGLVVGFIGVLFFVCQKKQGK